MKKYYFLKERIKRNEGFRRFAYRDILGFLTIGYGHLIKKNDKLLLEKVQSKKKLLKLFEKDFKKALNNFNNKLKFLTSNKKEAELIIEMIFQLGIKGQKKFKLMNEF